MDVVVLEIAVLCAQQRNKMPSPFPGMDPCIEHPAIWVDFHNSLADEIRPTYFTRLTPRTTYDVVEISQVRTQTVRPDLALFQPQPARAAAFAAAVIDTPSNN
jgi:hypothetical protein